MTSQLPGCSECGKPARGQLDDPLEPVDRPEADDLLAEPRVAIDQDRGRRLETRPTRLSAYLPSSAAQLSLGEVLTPTQVTCTTRWLGGTPRRRGRPPGP